MPGKISEMSDGGIAQGTDRIEITRDPLGTPTTLFQDMDGIQANINETLSHGIMSAQSGVTSEVTVDATPRKITAWNTDGLSKNMAVDSTTGNDITVEVDGVYLVVANISFSGSSGDNFHFEIYKNGSPTGFSTSRKLGTGGDVGAAPILGIVSLVATDTVSIFQSSSDGNAMTIEEAQLSLIRISA